MITRRFAIMALPSLVVLDVAKARTRDPIFDQELRSHIYKENSVATLGHKIPSPNDPVWDEARRVLRSAPFHRSPLSVAEYFASNIPEKFQYAWPEPDPRHPTLANPLIVQFFWDLKLSPAGDTVPWCAAFMNWCLTRSGLRGTASASSQSFKRWGDAVWSPASGSSLDSLRPGDVAVFRHNRNPTHGHVAFVAATRSARKGYIRVLGGNQIINHLHVIQEKEMPVAAELRLIAVRRG